MKLLVLDGLPDTPYPGVVIDTWNGWAVPAFTKGVAAIVSGILNEQPEYVGNGLYVVGHGYTWRELERVGA